MRLLSRRIGRARDARRAGGESAGWRRRISVFELWSLVLTTTAAATAAVLVNVGGEVFALRAGQTTARPIPSRVDFQRADRQQTELLRMRARESAPNCYVLDGSLIDVVRGRLMNALAVVRALRDDSAAVIEEARRANLVLDDAAIAELSRLAEAPEADEYARVVAGVVDALIASPLVEHSERAARGTAVEAALIDARTEPESSRLVPVGRVRYANNAESVQEVVEEAVRGVPEGLRASFRASLLALLRGPTSEPYRAPYRFSAERSARAAEQAAARIPVQMILYRAGSLLTDAGAIDPDELELLRAEHAAARDADRAAPDGWARFALRAASRGLLALVVIFGLSTYLSRYQQKVFSDPFRQTAATLLLLALLGLSRLTFLWGSAPPSAALGFLAFGAATLSIVYTRGSVFAICAALGMLITLAVQQNVTFLIAAVAVSGVFVVGLGDVRSRGKIVGVGSAAAGAAFLIMLAAGILQDQRAWFYLHDALWAAGATLVAAFVIEGVLPAIERIFGFSTSMTLLEWCDANKPLLRMMAAEAPGTYNHSLQVGALAEAAAEAIGANGLLCRTGSYYHDVGKISKPQYFVENQPEGVSRHDRLTPAMSLLIIVGHVKEGLEMAREYGLPASLRPFIAEHHGTTLVEYFYHAATKQRKPGDREIAETEYRYPGPRPQSRETAIVMLCDGVEGAARTIDEPTPGRIESVVSDIIRKRLLDGQLDQCDLTFRELATIEKTLVRSLCGLYHSRIVYPETTEKPEPRRGDDQRPGDELRRPDETRSAS